MLESTSEPSFNTTIGNERMTLLEIRPVKSEGSFERSVTAALKHLHDLSRDDLPESVATSNDDVTQISTATEKDDITVDSSSFSVVTDSRYSSEVEQNTSSLPSLQVTTMNLEIPAPFRPPRSTPYDVHGYRASRFYEHLHLDDIEEKPIQRSRSVSVEAIRFHSSLKAGQSRLNFGWLKRKESKHKRNKTV